MKKLTITFDNGPFPEVTPDVLNILDDYAVKTTFFVCADGGTPLTAKAAQPAQRALLEDAQRRGHWIGNHTLTHTVRFGATDNANAAEDEIGTNQLLLGNLVDDRRLFRPYAGGGLLDERLLNPTVVDYIRDNGYTMVLFNSVSRDWERPDTWIDHALADIHRHDWTLTVLHDIPSGAMSRLPKFLDRVRELGVEIVQDYPDDCVPIVRGEITGSLAGLIRD